jgi:membrane protease YdiL (CAAX protease family)
VLILSALFTAGLLRRFHEGTPTSPYVPTVVGSLLFAAVFLLLLVSAREMRLGGARGPGIRIGSLTPLLLMLLMEKWLSLIAYNPLFYAISPPDAADAELDAMYVAFGGVGLLALCLLVGWFSAPTAATVWRWARPARWPAAAGAALLAIGATYGILGGAVWAIGGGLRLEWPPLRGTVAWILCGQTLLAFSEELYYRGLLLAEIRRLAPRLGVRSRALGRWLALVATSALFGFEHLNIHAPTPVMLRQALFTVSLGLLFGVLVLVTENLHFVAAIHAWINTLLLGAAPRFVDASGQPAPAAGTYVGVGLIVAFCTATAIAAYGRRRAAAPGTGDA